MSVLVVGSVAYDSIETPFGRIEDALGGSATFFSTAASYFADVNLVAVVGDDFEHEQLGFLEERGVDLDGLIIERGRTFRWKGRYLKNMNDRETIETQLNVFETFNPVLPKKYRNSEYVFLANIGPELQCSVIEQVNNPKFVALDTMNYWISGSRDALLRVLQRVDAILINDSEVKELSGEENIFTGSRVIREMGPKTIIVKKGENGALMIHGDRYFFCPAYPVERLFDPTGAGDTFAGGFMGYLAMSNSISEENLRRAIVFGSALASFCVEDFSIGRLKNIDKQDIKQRIILFKSMTYFEEDQKWALDA